MLPASSRFYLLAIHHKYGSRTRGAGDAAKKEPECVT